MCPLGYRLTALVETGDFTLGAGFKGGQCTVLYLYFQLKLALPTCALAIKALAVSARAASREHRPAEEAQGGQGRAGRAAFGRAGLGRAAFGRTAFGRAGGCAVAPAWGLPTLRGGRPGLCPSPALQVPAGASVQSSGGDGVAHRRPLTSAQSRGATVTAGAGVRAVPGARCEPNGWRGMKYRGGRALPGGNTWLFFLAIHHMQPK